jgi:hypothetical protein
MSSITSRVKMLECPSTLRALGAFSSAAISRLHLENELAL